jgi:hypothetical protein
VYLTSDHIGSVPSLLYAKLASVVLPSLTSTSLFSASQT